MTQIQAMKLEQDFDLAGEHLTMTISDLVRLRDSPAAFANNASAFLDSALAGARNALDCVSRARTEIARLHANRPAEQLPLG